MVIHLYLARNWENVFLLLTASQFYEIASLSPSSHSGFQLTAMTSPFVIARSLPWLATKQSTSLLSELNSHLKNTIP